MSSDWWLNNIGSFATATTPSGSVPQYGVAYDVGTGQWPDAQSFNDFVSAQARRTHAPDIQALEAAKRDDDQGWFQKALSGTGHFLGNVLGQLHRDVGGAVGEDPYETYVKNNPHPMPRAQFERLGGYEQNKAIGNKVFEDVMQAPVVSQLNEAYNFASNVLETPLILDRNTGMTGDLGLWTDKSAWAKAWQEADDRTLGQALVESIVAGKGTTEADLDRMRRTNSLYGMASFATDLYAGAKLDPTVLGAKAGGELSRIAKGQLPDETSRLRPEALRVARGQAPAQSLNPLTRYASYRGKAVNARFDDLRDYAKNHSLTDMTGLPMFRRKAVNGAQAALAFKLAAHDDTLWDLTQRAVLADPVAWKQIRDLKHSVPEDIKAFAPADTQTYLDAIDATKGRMTQLENQVTDLEKVIAKREAEGPQPLYADRPNGGVNPGFFDHYTWELHRDLEAKKADVTEMARKLESHQDYGDWLANLPHVYGDDIYQGPVVSLDQVSTKSSPLDSLSQHTYQKSTYSTAHQVTQITKSGWTMKANPIDLNRVDSGVESIRRQFEQFDYLMGYKNPEGLENALSTFLRAPDQFERFKVAKQIEDEHLVNALSQKFGIERDTLDLFLNQTRLRKNDMMNALLSGEGAVYSTGSMMDTAKLVSRDKGMAEIEVVDNGVRRTMRVPEEALQPQTMPVDPSQTPNTYMPMDTRQVYLAVKRNNELFEALDEDVRQFGAKRTAKVMEAINAGGTAFNSLWKPVQLFRLAWPQRVIMDEGLRSLAIVGSNMFFRNFGAAARDAALNAINPLEHGIMPARQRKKFKAGPGPLTDSTSGRNIDSALHEEILEDAPVVPSYYAPVLHKERYAALNEQLAQAAEVRRIEARRKAIFRNPNSLESLPRATADMTIADWFDISQAVKTGRIEGTDFTLEDIAKAKVNLSDRELVTSLDGRRTGLIHDIEDPNLPLILGELAENAGNYSSTRAQALVQRYGIGGSNRARLEQAIAEGRKEFDQELAHRKTGAGHGPLFSGIFSDLEMRSAQRDMLLARELGAEWVPVGWGARNPGNITRTISQLHPRAQYTGPLYDKQQQLANSLHSGDLIETIDAATGKPTKSGYTIPIAEQDAAGIEGLLDFANEHKELLGSQGYRLQFEKNPRAAFGEPGYKVRLVRVFRRNEIRKATDFADHVGADGFLSIHDGHKHYVRDWNDKSAIAEVLDRKFWNQEQQELVPGEAPVEGTPGVFHGAPRELPENLLPKEEVPVVHGNMVGQGFYTTMSHEVAESYGADNLYTIRGSKTGKVYKTFDMDKEPTPEERTELHDFIVAHYREHDPHLLERPTNNYVSSLDYALNEIEMAPSWVEIMGRLESAYVGNGNGVQPQALVTKYLEDVKGAGALTHEGGRVTGGRSHQVYVWLHPEDLEVRPAYVKTGKFESLEAWLLDPNSQEGAFEDLYYGPNGEVLQRPAGRPMNQVPENRIHRVGMKPNVAARHEEAQKARTDLSPANAEMRDFDDLNFNFQMDSVHDAFMRKLFKRRQFGRGTSSWKSADGQKIVANNALEGAGEVYLPLISSNPVYTRLTDTYKRTLSKYREKAAGYKSTPPPDVSPEAMKTTAGRKALIDYYTSWADLVNDQVRNSPIWYRMLQGQTDDQIIRWLTSTDEGARLRKSLPHMGHRPEKWVEEHRQRLNSYVPDKDLQAVLKDRQIKPSEFRRIPAENLPTIYEPDLQMISGIGPLAKMYTDTVNKIYHALGTVPSDLLVRQPFFKSLYDLKMRNLIKATDSEHLSNDVLRGYERLAREFALRQVRKNLYDLADETNLGQALRFVAPFWGAQQEAMVKWSNIVLEKPETMAKFYVGVNQTYNHFQVIDEDGNPVEARGGPFTRYKANDRVTFQIPEAFLKHEPFKTLLGDGSFKSLGVAFGAANTALQGDNPIMPSLGPLVTMPADLFVNALWDTHGAEFDDNFFYRWLFPVGRPKAGISGKLEQMFPGWGRRINALGQGQDNRSYANTFYSVYRELDLDHRKRGLPPPTMDEVEKATKWHFGLRVLASFAAPAAMEFRPKNQLWLDEYHKMQDLYGPDAFTKFVQKYGADAARYASSSSNSPVGVPPTGQAMEEWSQNKALIQQFPEWGGAIISPDAWADDFSSDAYNAQFDIKQGPGTNERLRESVDPVQRMNETDSRLGWLEYRQLTSGLNAELYRRGLNSLQQSGAEDLEDIKRAAVAEIERKYPSWSNDFHTFEDTIYSKVGQLQSFAFDPQFNNRPDMQGVRQYLALRDMAAQSLDSYAASTGGSRSLQAQENSALRDWFYTQVGDLIQQNPAFGEFYSRYLESDRLERGSGP